MIGEFIGRVPDLPPLREQFKLACGPAYVMITWFVSRSTGYSVSSVSAPGIPIQRSGVGCIVGVALSGSGILNSCFLRLFFFDVAGFQRFSRCAISPLMGQACSPWFMGGSVSCSSS